VSSIGRPMAANWSQSPLKTHENSAMDWEPRCISWSSSLRCNSWVFDLCEKKSSRVCQASCECRKPSTSLMDSSIREENSKLISIWFVWSQELCSRFGFVTPLESVITAHGAVMLPSKKLKSSWPVNRGINWFLHNR